ncbi:ArsR/SmtB family transcription factor [Halobaculum sp. MBLA0147]|uniref:ArsR/SmtB family transcription factor n=1 Tax=Halobaculum sp. MBLA0147 TaxID=3079934 RepID=UPI00352692E4
MDREGQVVDGSTRRVERELLGDGTDLDTVAEWLDALGDERRFRIVYRLCRHRPMTTGQLAEALEASQNSLYYHVSALVDAGLIEAVGEGRSRRYRPTAAGLSVAENVFDAVERATARDDSGSDAGGRDDSGPDMGGRDDSGTTHDGQRDGPQ